MSRGSLGAIVISGVCLALVGWFVGRRHFQKVSNPSPSGAQGTSRVQSTAQVLAAIEKVNNFWLSKNTPGDANWLEATYFAGDLAAYDATRQSNYVTFAQTWATKNSYNVCGTACGEGLFDPDYQAAGESYIRLYQLSNKATDLSGIKRSVDAIVQSNAYDYWTIPDDINMSAPSFVELGSIYNDTSYYTTMDRLYSYIRNSLGLWNPATGLWWESSARIDTSTGYWSRGNGWAFAALAKILSVLPQSDPEYPVYLSDFKTMAQSLAALQQPGGYWNQDLGDATDQPGPESSGTSFFLYGFAWGINNGILDRRTYLPLVENAWNFLANTAIQPSGLLGYVQAFQLPAPITPTTTNDFGVGAFLLGARQFQLLTLQP
jgi:rhamnogalacturonyl hydrolase YesR